MTTWTRAHDAHIAKHCEGLAVEWRISGVGQSGPVDWCFLSPMPFIPHGGEPQEVWVPVKHYLTDPAAAIRTAEAWRKKMLEKGERYWVFESGLEASDRPSVRLYTNGGKKMFMEFGDTLSAALAQALYRATGGPA